MPHRLLKIFLWLITILMVCDFVHSLTLAFHPDKTDFSELYTSAWLWRHSQNPYNSALATATQQQLVGSLVQINPIYLPTGLVLISPLTLLPWGWANLIWLLLGSAGVAATIFLLLRLWRHNASALQTLAFITFLLSFDPLHQAFHLGNAALVAVPFALCSIVLAEKGTDGWAGIILGIELCLKPQIGIWILAYYLLQRRKRLFFGVLIAGMLISAIALMKMQPIPLTAAITDYQANLHYWFDPGQHFGFAEGAFPFHVNMMQVVIYQLSHSILASKLIAHGIFLIGIILWALILWRSRFRAPAALAISSLLALSFLSLYHGVPDATILTLAFCWAFPSASEPSERTKTTPAKTMTCILLLLMMLPGHSALMRLCPHLSRTITAAWWWNLFIARYFVWLLFALAISLLAGLLTASKPSSPSSLPGKKTVYA
jgi:hypothetical protein